MSKYLYAVPTAQSIARFNNIFMSAPMKIDVNFNCCVDIIEDQIPENSLLKVVFKKIDVVTTTHRGIEIPETVAYVDFLNYDTALDPMHRHIIMCGSYLVSKSARHFFSSIKEILCHKEGSFDFVLSHLSDSLMMTPR
jgi:hypothetical protein